MSTLDANKGQTNSRNHHRTRERDLGKEDLVRFKRKIKKYLKGGDTYTVNDVNDFLTAMQQQQASYQDLEESGIALTIKNLRTESTVPDSLRRNAKLVLKKWKRQMEDELSSKSSLKNAENVNSHHHDLNRDISTLDAHKGQTNSRSHDVKSAKPKMPTKRTMTLTFSTGVENHRGNQVMEVPGADTTGLSAAEMRILQQMLEQQDIKCELIDLNLLLPSETKADSASLLVARNAVSILTGESNDDLFEELSDRKWDSKCIMYKRVVNKLMRENICITDQAQAPCYEEGKGTVVPFTELPRFSKVREAIGELGM